MTTTTQSFDTQSFLRRALLGDALASAATGLLLVFGADALSGLTGLPVALMRYAGLSLLPFAVLVTLVGMRQRPARAAVLAVIVYNALWAIDSLALIAAGLVTPTLLGSAFVIAQAVTVAAFAGLQWIGLRRADKV